MQDLSGRSTAELVSDIASDVQQLVRKELELARVELMEGLRSSLVGAGVIAAAVVASLPGLLFLTIALALWLPVSNAVGFAIVGGVMLLFTVAGVALGVRKLKSKKPTVGTAVESIKEDVRWARGHLTR